MAAKMDDLSIAAVKTALQDFQPFSKNGPHHLPLPPVTPPKKPKKPILEKELNTVLVKVYLFYLCHFYTVWLDFNEWMHKFEEFYRRGETVCRIMEKSENNEFYAVNCYLHTSSYNCM